MYSLITKIPKKKKKVIVCLFKYYSIKHMLILARQKQFRWIYYNFSIKAAEKPQYTWLSTERERKPKYTSGVLREREFI